MNLNRIIQSLLIMLAVVGVFAAMARNAYGFDFIGVACVGLSLLFLVQLGWIIVSEYGSIGLEDIPEILELLLLSVLTLLLGLRAFYIYVPHADVIFIIVCVLQLIVYAVMGYGIATKVRKENISLAQKLVFFYSSILLFLLFLVFGSQAWSIYIAALALIVASPFLISVFLRKEFQFESKSVSLFHVVAASKNKAGLLFSFFIASALFAGLSYWGIVPSIVNVDRPKDYIELIGNAEGGKEKPINGKYQHEEYKVEMDKFLKRHGTK